MSDDSPFLPPRVGETSPPPPPPRPAALPTGTGGPPRLPTAGAAIPHVVPEHHAVDALSHFQQTLHPSTGSGPNVAHKRLKSRAAIAIFGVCVSIAATALGSLGELDKRRELIRARDGAGLSVELAERLDDRTFELFVVWLVCLVVAAVCFLVWFHRAYKNLKSMGRNRLGAGWAIGGWFVPFLNLVRPYQIMKELVTSSSPARRVAAGPLVGLWWATLMINSVLQRVLVATEPDSIDGLVTRVLFGVGADSLWVVAGVLLVALIVRVTKAQDSWFARNPASRASR